MFSFMGVFLYQPSPDIRDDVVVLGSEDLSKLPRMETKVGIPIGWTKLYLVAPNKKNKPEFSFSILNCYSGFFVNAYFVLTVIQISVLGLELCLKVYLLFELFLSLLGNHVG